MQAWIDRREKYGDRWLEPLEEAKPDPDRSVA